MKSFIFYFYFFLFFLLSLFVSGVVESTDGLQFLAVARNIYYGKGPTAPPYEYNTRQNVHMTTYVAKNGKNYSFTGLGFSLAMIPAAALADMVYKYYSVSPPIHFPLESDWIILLFASFTNVFFASLLGVILFLFFIELKIPKKQAVFLTLISIFTTNLFTFSKHLMPHMMFVAFLILSFYFQKIYFKTKKRRYIMFSGLAFGIVTLTYNLTYLLAIPPYIIYYILLKRKRFDLNYIKTTALDIFYMILGAIPFLSIYYWFENLRVSDTIHFASPAAATNFASGVINGLPISIFIEGIYGLLLSPGRSVFIYSPLLLIIIFFWYKIKKTIYPELFLFISYTIILLTFYSMAFFASAPGQGAAGIWHGESSWGPRYLSPILPLGMIIVAYIFTKVSTKIKLLVFLPLALIGLSVECLGVLMPYQIKFHELESGFKVNGTYYNVYAYSNLLPRYTPILMMTKKLYKLVTILPETINNGIYNVRFLDGINFAFNVGPERWRSIEGAGYISFNNNNQNINTISFDIINHPISNTKADANINIILNGRTLFEKPVKLKISERKTIELPIKPTDLKEGNNEMIVNVDYGNLPILKENSQILGLLAMYINGTNINLESIDVPSVSPLAAKMTNAVYHTWGGTDKDPWKIWDIHSQTFERLPDIWWIRNLYYWDVPKKWILGLFGFNIFGLIFTGIKTISSYKKIK